MPNLKQTLIETGSYGLVKGSLHGSPLSELSRPMSLVSEAVGSYAYDAVQPKQYIPHGALNGRGREIQKALAIGGGKVAFNMLMGSSMSGRQIMVELAAQGLGLELSRYVKEVL